MRFCVTGVNGCLRSRVGVMLFEELLCNMHPSEREHFLRKARKECLIDDESYKQLI